jgi:hypothetical protein
MVEEMNNAASVGIIVAIVVGGAILIFFWALFPILVLSALKKQLAKQQEILRCLESMRTALTAHQEDFADAAIIEARAAEPTVPMEAAFMDQPDPV